MANHKAELKKRVPWENDKWNSKNKTEKKMLCELIIELGYTNLDSYCMTHHAIYYVIFIHPFQVWMKL